MMQKGKSRNVLASPLGEEGHEVAKGVQANWIHRGVPRPANPVRRHPAKSVWMVVILIMILDVDVTAEGSIIKLIARRAIQIKKAVKMAVLKFHQWNELLKSSIQKKIKYRLLP